MLKPIDKPIKTSKFDGESIESVTVIIVTFNSAYPLEQLLQSLPTKIPIIVVDNSSKDNTVAVAEQFGAQVIRNEKNIGYSSACNLGSDAATTEYILFLNPDTRVQPNTINQLYKAVNRHPYASALAPLLLDQRGKISLLSKSVLVSENHWLPRELPKCDFEVPAISGAAIFISRRTFAEVGKFDENLFIYYEDDDLSYRLLNQFGPILIVPSAELIHLGGRSSPSSSDLINFKRYHHQRSKAYVTRKHGVPYSVRRRIFVCSLKFLICCVIFQRDRQLKYFHLLMGLLSLEDENRYKITLKLLESLANCFKISIARI